MSLLWASLATLIPVVGPMVLSGWLVSLFWARRDSDDPARFPAFDFQFFVKYLERGLWPFLVSLVAGLALTPVLLVLMLAVMVGSGAFAPHAHRAAMNAFGVVLIGGAMISYLVALLVFHFVTQPMLLRATITQSFTEAFNFGFVRRYLALVWMETLIVALVLFGAGLVMMVVALVTCYIGLFPSVVIMSFAWQHLQKQLYQLYLSRGGEVVALSSKLIECPPVLPPAVG